jgi:hypothetical protein
MGWGSQFSIPIYYTDWAKKSRKFFGIAAPGETPNPEVAEKASPT